MKKLYFLLFFVPFIGLSQVGIGTKEPTKTLDIDGDLRIRKVPRGDQKNDFVFVVNEKGEVLIRDVEEFNGGNEYSVRPPQKAYDVTVNSKTDPMGERFSPSLDLWLDQQLYGDESIKDIYFLGLRHRVTLPANRTTAGDGKIRKITFIIIQNNLPEGFGHTSESQAFDRWHVIFQTKKYEVNSNNSEGCFTEDETYLYEPYKYSSLFVPDPAGAYVMQNNDATNARLKMRYQAQIRDREIVFYDFNGKWIMSVRD